jgi:hypothetical protein
MAPPPTWKARLARGELQVRRYAPSRQMLHRSLTRQAAGGDGEQVPNPEVTSHQCHTHKGASGTSMPYKIGQKSKDNGGHDGGCDP